MTQSLIGQTLNHYTIVDKLGEGGMGVVYLAEDTSLGRRVALKVLPENATHDDALLERLKREARVIANLNHPNIVTLHAVEQERRPGDDGRTFLVMELIEGETLTRHTPVGGMTLERFFEIAIPMADAIATAHEAGISHRDIKPSNILVTQQGRVKVLDFGLAKQLSEAGSGANEDDITQVLSEQLTTEGSVMGTVPYMAPEQLMGKPGGPAGDVFSLGIVYYQMLTGRHPFRSGASPAEVVSAILRDQPRPLSEFQIEIPNHLGRILRRCLEKEPERRYQQALELKNELLGLRGEVTSGTWRPLVEGSSGNFSSTRGLGRVGPGDGHRSLLARFPGGAGGLAGSALAVLVAIVLGVILFGRETTPVEPAEARVTAPERSLPADAVTLAVLPLEDLGGGDASFARALTGEISSALTALGGLNVVAQSSVTRVAGESPRVISDSLGVNHLLSGSIAWEQPPIEGRPRRIRLNMQLVHADSELQVWSDSWTREVESPLEAQSEIAQRIAAGLGDRLLGIVPDIALEKALEKSHERTEVAAKSRPEERPSGAGSSAIPERKPLTEPNERQASTAAESSVASPSAPATRPDEGKSTLHVEFRSRVPDGIITIYSGSRAILRRHFESSGKNEPFFEDTVSFEDQGEALRVYVVPRGEAARYRSFDLKGERQGRLVLEVDRDGDFNGKLHRGKA